MEEAFFKEVAEHESTWQKMATMKREHKAEWELLEKTGTEKTRKVTAPQTYTETAVQTEEVLDAMTEDPNGVRTALPEELPTREANGKESYAQAATQAAPTMIAPPHLAPTAHTEGALDEWRYYEDLSDYEKEDSGYESARSSWGRRRRTKRTTATAATGRQHVRPSAQAVVIHSVSTQHKPGTMWQWIQEDNTGIEVMGARWLLSENRRRGKAASSLVIYTESTEEVVVMWMGRKQFLTERYDWNRGHRHNGTAGIPRGGRYTRYSYHWNR